jgi:siderophore synthetase component
MIRNEPRPTQSASSLADELRDKRRRWQAELEQCGLDAAAACLPALPAQLAAAGRNMVARLALAMLQEGILPAGTGGEVVTLPLAQFDDDGAALVLRGLLPDSPSLFPALRVFRRDGQGGETAIEDPIELLVLVAPVVPGATPEVLSRLAGEVADAMRNDALCRAYRADWNDRLRGSVRAARKSGFWDWLRDRPDRQNQTILLEQWGAVGHPYHPTHKTRVGMTPAEVLTYCPEFEPQVPVALAAARGERVRGETMSGSPSRERWLDIHFPAQAEAWRNALTERKLDPDGYVAMPLHPWQARHVIPERFSRSIASGDLILLSSPVIPSTPLVSVRTLVPAAPREAPHLKLSLAVRLTSVERTISPRSCEMGPRISKLLLDLIESDATLSSTLRILPETAGMYFASAASDELEESRHLAALLRSNSSDFCASDEIVIPTTAMTTDSPITGTPLFVELSGGKADLGPAEIRTRFSDYAQTFLRPLLTLYLRYGIGLEAHQQNTLARYSRGGVLQGFIFRDFGGIRIHEASLRAAGLELEVHPDRLTVVDDLSAVRNKLISRALVRHLGFLISCICLHQRVGEGPFWSDVADVIQTILDELRGDVALATWRQERAAFLCDDWSLKANLRMRFDDLAHDVYVRVGNPLRRHGAT